MGKYIGGGEESGEVDVVEGPEEEGIGGASVESSMAPLPPRKNRYNSN